VHAEDLACFGVNEMYATASGAHDGISPCVRRRGAVRFLSHPSGDVLQGDRAFVENCRHGSTLMPIPEATLRQIKNREVGQGSLVNDRAIQRCRSYGGAQSPRHTSCIGMWFSSDCSGRTQKRVAPSANHSRDM
jgi:hypothetical protein